MGKIVMPKNSALLNEIESVLKIYYEEGSWLSNTTYKNRLKELIGNNQYSSSYTKKSQITSYFGFTEWKDISNPQSERRITETGKQMYEAIQDNNNDRIQELLMYSLENVEFGRNNFGCPESNSDIEPPVLFLRACIDLNYLTYQEFAFLLWKLEDVGGNYTDSIDEIRKGRINSGITLDTEAEKYVDCKPIMVLVRWGFLAEDSSINNSRTKHIIINPEVKHKYEKRIKNLKIYNIDKDINDALDENIINNNPLCIGGTNELLYGVPGSGKSFTIDNIVKDSDYERVVFHPDYTYSDFVGQIMPRLKMNEDGTEKLTYEFVPGPFTKALKTAENDKDHMHYLIIEEINRGNAPAIFGDIFQLLDRDEDGQGKYCITNYDIAREVFGEENETTAIRIPSNLSILATMNTSDQNVFTLDTAFQRRWNMKYIENNITGAAHANDKIEHSDITWGSFASVVNEEILEYSAGLASSEDKQLGAYFVGKDELSSDRFPEKALKYLWDDAFKLERDKIFNQEIKSIGDIISSYEKNIQQGNDPIKGVLKWEVYKKMMDMSADSIEEAIDESEIFETETIDGE